MIMDLLITSSPQFPQSNGEAEHAVKTVKAPLKICDDRKDDYLVLMGYQVTSTECGYNPAELLMSYSLNYQIFQLCKRKSKR